MSKIEWTQETWNPITGCSKASPGCKNCYAERMARRLKAMGLPQYQDVINDNGRWNGKIEFVESALNKPRCKAPTTYFVNSMSDLFHPNVEFDWLDKIWRVMAETRYNTYQILTKRARLLPQRIGAIVDKYGILPNVWVGVSVETAEYLNRIDSLRNTQAAIRFLSLEPLLGPLTGLNLDGIDWVIAGGESGPGARPIEADWVRSIRDECIEAEVPFFFKQWGGTRKVKLDNLLDGVRWLEYPQGVI